MILTAGRRGQYPSRQRHGRACSYEGLSTVAQVGSRSEKKHPRRFSGGWDGMGLSSSTHSLGRVPRPSGCHPRAAKSWLATGFMSPLALLHPLSSCRGPQASVLGHQSVPCLQTATVSALPPFREMMFGDLVNQLRRGGLNQSR